MAEIPIVLKNGVDMGGTAEDRIRLMLDCSAARTVRKVRAKA
jgi:hypothetical protein